MSFWRQRIEENRSNRIFNFKNRLDSLNALFEKQGFSITDAEHAIFDINGKLLDGIKT